MNVYNMTVRLTVPDGKTVGEVREFAEEILGGFGFSNKHLSHPVDLQAYEIDSLELVRADASVDERAAQLGPSLYVAAKGLYDKICNITGDEFSKGGEKREREALASLLTAIDGQERD